MDISDSTGARFDLGIERFLENDPVAYGGVVFCKTKEQSVHVVSYSDWWPENTSESHAREKIERSKMVLNDLASRSSAFRSIVERMPLEYYCCYDYGKGTIPLAKEVGGGFQWLG